MKQSRRTFLSVVGVYAAGSWVVLQVIDVLNQNIGLPPWAFSLALTFLLIGLPIVGVTAWLQSRTPDHGTGGSEARTGSSTGPWNLFTWRNAALAGLGAMALWGIFATAWMVRERGDERAGPDAGSVSAIPEGPTGFVTIRTRPAGAGVESRRVESVEGQLLDVPVALGTTPLEGTELRSRSWRTWWKVTRRRSRQNCCRTPRSARGWSSSRPVLLPAASEGHPSRHS
jgi:hypothetical protein